MNSPAAPLADGEYPTLRVAMCQVYTEEWAVDANLRRTLESLHEAKRLGADLAITPECGGPCVIELTYAGGGEYKICRWLSVLAMLGCAMALAIWRNASGLARQTSLLFRPA